MIFKGYKIRVRCINWEQDEYLEKFWNFVSQHIDKNKIVGLGMNWTKDNLYFDYALGTIDDEEIFLKLEKIDFSLGSYEGVYIEVNLPDNYLYYKGKAKDLKKLYDEKIDKFIKYDYELEYIDENGNLLIKVHPANVKIELTEIENLKEIHNLIIKRCEWFKENNIIGWGLSYPKRYNIDYFKKQMTINKVYVAKVNNKVIGSFVLKNTDDDYWKDDNKSFYIHHLVTDINYSGLGKILLKYAISEGKKHNKEYLKLDCFKSNNVLNEYYKDNGFINVGSGKKGMYSYNLWQKKIK